MLAIFLLLLLQEPTPAPKPTAEPPYEKVEPTSLDVQAAVKFAFSEQQKKKWNLQVWSWGSCR